MSPSILSEAMPNFDNISVDDLKAELAKVVKERSERQAKQKEYNSSPEARERHKAYTAKRNEVIAADPERKAALDVKRKEYNTRPEVKEKRKAYHAKRNARLKALIAEAEKRGIDLKALGA